MEKYVRKEPHHCGLSRESIATEWLTIEDEIWGKMSFGDSFHLADEF